MKIISVPIHIGDYLRDTRRLKATEHGAYFLLLLELYNCGGEIECDDDELMDVCRVSTKRQWKKVKPKILRLCQVDGNRITHNRVTQVIAEVKQKSDQAKRASNARWKKNPNKNNDGPVRAHSGRNSNLNQNQNQLRTPSKEGGAPKPSKRGHRLPKDWKPPDMPDGFYEENFLTETEVQHEAAKFYDYWTDKTGKDATKKDWLGTWRNWVRRDKEKRGRNFKSVSDISRSRTDAWKNVLDELPDERVAKTV